MNRRSFFGFLAGAPLAVAAGKVAGAPEAYIPLPGTRNIAALGIEIDHSSVQRQVGRLRSFRQELERENLKTIEIVFKSMPKWKTEPDEHYT